MENNAEHKIPTIVVIDDMFVNLIIVESHLEFHQVNLITKTSAIEIINEIDIIRPDVILMDLIMPDIPGKEAARLIKQNPLNSHIPIVAISASLEEIENIENDPAFSAVLNKPYTKEELLNVLSKFIHLNELSAIHQMPQKKGARFQQGKNLKTPIRRLLKSENGESSERDLSSIQFNGPTILAIDDIEVNLFLLESYIGGHNINLITKTSVLEAMKDLPKLQPDLILMDIMMPELNGREAAKQIKANNKTKHIPIISVTVNAKELELTTNDDTFAGTLGKPFTKTDLFKLLSQFMPYTETGVAE